MNLLNAKIYALREVQSSGISQHLYRDSRGRICVTDTDAYWHDEKPIGWFTPDGEWHVGAAPATAEVADPSDKSLATYDHDADPANDPKFWCVFEDDGTYRAEGYTTRAEAEAYQDALDYCQTMDLSIKGVFEADDEGSAIDKANAVVEEELK